MSTSKLDAGKAVINAALVAAVRKGQSRKVNDLLRQGADANTRAADGKPVLMLAVAADDGFNVINLLGAGADPNGRDAAGKPVVSELRSVSIGRLLLERGLDMASEGFDGTRLLEVAARAGEAQMVQDLLDRGVPLPKKMLLSNFWFGLDPKSEQARRVVNSHRMAARLDAAMVEHEEKPSTAKPGIAPL